MVSCKMPVERLRMRPWLENIINNHKYPGVEWLDEEKKIFRLPWKHASRNGWKINTDASLFRAWAEHTGKYKGDKEKTNAKIWKANFRCALNSLPDMEEVTERRSTKGTNAFKVYRIIDKMDSAETKKNNSKKYKGRYQRRKRPYSRTTSSQKEVKLEGKETVTQQLTQEEQSAIMESGEITTGFPFSVPQAYYKQHLVDHDYAVTRYFDLFDGAAGEEMSDVLPECKVIKTEPVSPTRRESEEYSFYEDENGNSKKLDDDDFLNEPDDKVMSDDEVIELIDEMSSECDSSAGSLDTMDELLDGSVDTFEKNFELPKRRANSAPACLQTSFDSLAALPTCMPVAKSKSFPDIHSILSTSPQEFLQSCLS